MRTQIDVKAKERELTQKYASDSADGYQVQRNKMTPEKIAAIKEENRLKVAATNKEILDLEKKLGIDGVKQGDTEEHFAVVGTTSYSAFTPATLRVFLDPK